MRRKKGDISAIPLFLIMVFFIAISFIVVAYVNTHFRDLVQNTAINQSTVTNRIVDQYDNMNLRTIQRGFIVVAGFLIIAIIASSFLIRIHPVFLFIYIIVLGFSIFMAVILSNAYDQIASTAVLQATANQQEMIKWFMEHLVSIIVGVGAMSMIVTFAKIFGAGGFFQTQGGGI